MIDMTVVKDEPRGTVLWPVAELGFFALMVIIAYVA